MTPNALDKVNIINHIQYFNQNILQLEIKMDTLYFQNHQNTNFSLFTFTGPTKRALNGTVCIRL